MRFLITGGAGFIGSHLGLELAKTGEEICIVDNFNGYYSSAFKSLRTEQFQQFKNIKIVEMDVGESYEFDSLIADFKPQTVFHLAAQAGVRLDKSEYGNYVSSNLVGFSNVLFATVNHSVPNFVYASSSSVYGNTPVIPFSEKDSKPSPISFYGATKLCNEMLASSMIPNSKTRARGLRFFTAYGPWGRPDMAYFRLVACALSGEAFTLFGSSKIRRDFTYIDDIIKATVALERDLNSRELGHFDVINLGGGSPVALDDLIQAVSSKIGVEIQIKHAERNVNDVQTTYADSALLNSIIGSTPDTPLQLGVDRFIEWASQENIKNHLHEWIGSVN